MTSGTETSDFNSPDVFHEQESKSYFNGLEKTSVNSGKSSDIASTNYFRWLFFITDHPEFVGMCPNFCLKRSQSLIFPMISYKLPQQKPRGFPSYPFHLGDPWAEPLDVVGCRRAFGDWWSGDGTSAVTGGRHHGLCCSPCIRGLNLGGGFKYFLFSPLFGEMIKFD